MPRYKDEPPAVRVYTVCDESRYLIVRNVPALGCGDDLLTLFARYGDIEECKPMDAEDCEPFTDVFWIKFRLISNARFAKRKLDEYVFMGNRLQVSYAPHFESLEDTKDKLEVRRKEVLARLNPHKPRGPQVPQHIVANEPLVIGSRTQTDAQFGEMIPRRIPGAEYSVHAKDYSRSRVLSDKEYFKSDSMNQTVRSVREKLNKKAAVIINDFKEVASIYKQDPNQREFELTIEEESNQREFEWTIEEESK